MGRGERGRRRDRAVERWRGEVERREGRGEGARDRGEDREMERGRISPQRPISVNVALCGPGRNCIPKSSANY